MAMHCPRCGAEGGPRQDICARCGYDLRRSLHGLRSDTSPAPFPPARGTNPYTLPDSNPVSSLPLARAGTSPRKPASNALPASSSSRSGSASHLKLGTLLDEGRYRLMSPMALPETQQRQGSAWTALDLQASQRQVIIREVLAPEELARGFSSEQFCYAVAQRLQRLGQHSGFPTVHHFFTEHGSSFLVLAYPEGVSLASLLKRHGGALPEDQVATYGHQLCDLLTLMAEQEPPFVHGSINPETIFINEEQDVASLIHLPLFQPDPPPSSSGQVSAGYYAPEQVHGELNPTADLYGLAVTMHHMVTGYDPRSRLALFHPPARRLNPTVTKQMELILVRQLSLSISQRYASPAEMQRDLAALIEAYPASSNNSLTRKEVSPLQISAAELQERSRNTLMLNMGVFAAICVLLVIGILLVLLR